MLGRRIRAYRERLGLSQAALARRIGVTQATVAAWELGRRPVRHVYIDALARVLDFPASEIAQEPPATASGPPLLDSIRTAIAVSAVKGLARGLLLEGGLSATEVANILSTTAVEIGPSFTSERPEDLVTQAEAARIAGVSRQAINEWLVRGGIGKYPNPSRADRAPMVSLAEIRAVMGHRAEGATSDGDATADRAPEAIRPLNPEPSDADTTPGGSPLPERRTPAEPASDEGLPDPPWLSDKYVRETFRESSAAAIGVAFDALGQEEQDELVRIQTAVIREVWREKTAEERAEMIARWQKRRPS